MRLPDTGATRSRSPTAGRRSGSTRTIASCPAIATWTSVSEPSGSTSWISAASPPSRVTAKCSGRTPSVIAPADGRCGNSAAASSASPPSSTIRPASSRTGRKFIEGEPIKLATNAFTGCS